MVRVSGPDAVAIAGDCFDADGGDPLEEIRQPTAVAGRVRFDLDGERSTSNPPLPLPTRARRSLCRAICFCGRRIAATRASRWPSCTRLAQRPCCRQLLAAVCCAGARLAEPGEFTLRAFLAGRIDLTQAEAVLGVIDARGADELDAALAQLAGGLARPLHRLRDDLLQLLAELEAGLDFVERTFDSSRSKKLSNGCKRPVRLLEDVAKQMSVAPHVEPCSAGRTRRPAECRQKQLVQCDGTDGSSRIALCNRLTPPGARFAATRHDARLSDIHDFARRDAVRIDRYGRR